MPRPASLASSRSSLRRMHEPCQYKGQGGSQISMQPAWSPDRMEGPSRSARRPPVWPSCRHAPTYGVVRTKAVVVTTRLSPMTLVLWSTPRDDFASALSWQSPVHLTSCKAAWEASLDAYVLAALLAVGYGPTGDISPHTRISHL